MENQIKALQLNRILLEKEIKVRDLMMDLKKLFYQIDAGKKTISLQERILNLSLVRLEQVQAQYSKGLRSELELLSAQISVSRDRPALEKAKIDQEKRFITLRQYMGLSPEMSIEIIPLEDLAMRSDITSEDLLSAVFNNREMKASRLKLEIEEKNRTLSGRNLRSPSVGLSLGWSSNINPLLESESWTKERWGDSLGLGLSLSVPLDPWLRSSEAHQSLQRQDDSIEKTVISLDDSLRNMKDSVNSLLLDLKLSQANVNVTELSIELQEKTFDKVRQNYESGRSSLLDLDDSRQELQKALVSLEEEKLKMNLLLLQLEYLTDSRISLSMHEH